MRCPGAPRGHKKACGENPKRVYDSRNQSPQTRMGNVAMMRATWQRAVEYRERRARDPNTPRDFGLDTVVDVLEGRTLVHNHCFRRDELRTLLDIARRFGLPVARYRHAVEAYELDD